jgi:hypothetical protein
MTEVNCCFVGDELTPREALGKAFVTALLLTGSVEQSEAAVLESIERLDLDHDAPGEKLIRGALHAALGHRSNSAGERPGQLEPALSLLPMELQRVVRLPVPLRHCFTLYVLAGLPASVSAPLLNLGISQVKEAAGNAAEMLARADRKATVEPSCFGGRQTSATGFAAS